MEIRESRREEIPRMKELWRLAFGDEEEYIQHFFSCYYQPQRMLVLEDQGAVQTMTAWFPIQMVFPDGRNCPGAYLYSVATHPQVRGQGLAGRLLEQTDQWLQQRGMELVTTVPAQKSLHTFFGSHGFQEGLFLGERKWTAQELDTVTPGGSLVFLNGKEYGVLREKLLKHCPHIQYSQDGLSYQEGVCRNARGGLFGLFTDQGEACLCVEGMGNGALMVKECLTEGIAEGAVLAALARQMPATEYWVRSPQGSWAFGMLKWLTPPEQQVKEAYLGLAFD